MQKLKKHNYLVGIILYKPRNEPIIKQLHDLGIIVLLIVDSDVLAAIDVINKEADFVYGIGGAPEGALMAALAIAARGQHENSTSSISGYFAKDLVNDDHVRFIATGLTAGDSLKIIKYYHGTYYLNTFFVSHGLIRNMFVTYSISQVNKLLSDVKTIMEIYSKFN